VARLAESLRAAELDLMLVTTPVNVRYLTGFTGSSGSALVAPGPPGGEAEVTFFTDFRYQSQSAEQLPDRFARQIVTGDLLEAVARSLGDHTSARLGFEAADLTFKQHARLSALAPPGIELVACPDPVGRLRAVKDEGETARIAAAAALADEALREVLEAGLVGRSEREVAVDLELRMRRLGADSPSFSSIVAAGPHGALPHAQPRAEPIPADVLVTIDWGALHEGYCSDCTRTYATGEGISAEAREIYQLVLEAELQALAAARAGPTGTALDAVARRVIEEAGYGEHFGHGLGHGVGMDIHEAPRLARTAGDYPLLAGNVVTIEPGVYLPGKCGVRIEDLVIIREDGAEILTRLEKELTVIS
jgi:Xaa-Pro aminopeptidase